jgi:pimeloyl-ACP methyl ester carboxylesterase
MSRFHLHVTCAAPVVDERHFFSGEFRMPRPIVFIHGYSANGAAFDPLRDALVAYCSGPGKTALDPADIDICTYVSLNNEVTITDIAEGLDRALRSLPRFADGQEFDVIVHSTGMLVIRAWLANQARPAGMNTRLKRIKHLIGVAPATWGSPQASKGRTFLGALVKGNRQIGPDFLNAGDRVLQGLELGSAFTWNLAHLDLLGQQPFYDKGPDTPFVSIFIGNRGYEGVDSIANSPGSDGTVRWAGCALNTRKITLDLTRTPVNRDGRDQRFSITPWVDSRIDIPMIAVDDRDHGSLIAEPEPGMVALIADFLQVGEPGGETYEAWLERARKYGEKGKQRMLVNPAEGASLGEGQAARFFEHLIGANPDEPLDGWQQFVVHAVDTHGYGINDYFLELFLVEGDGSRTPCQQLLNDVHAYGVDNSFRCFHVKLPRGITDGGRGLIARIHASTGTDLMCYQGYGDNQEKLTASAEPVELNISALAEESGSFFCPFTTTLIEIQLNREPLPLNEVSRLLMFLTPKADA